MSEDCSCSLSAFGFRYSQFFSDCYIVSVSSLDSDESDEDCSEECSSESES